MLRFLPVDSPVVMSISIKMDFRDKEFKQILLQKDQGKCTPKYRTALTNLGRSTSLTSALIVQDNVQVKFY